MSVEVGVSTSGFAIIYISGSELDLLQDLDVTCSVTWTVSELIHGYLDIYRLNIQQDKHNIYIYWLL